MVNQQITDSMAKPAKIKLLNCAVCKEYFNSHEKRHRHCGMEFSDYNDRAQHYGQHHQKKKTKVYMAYVNDVIIVH